MARLERAHLGFDGEQAAEKILEMRREIDDQVGLGLLVERGRVGARGHQPVVQRHIARGEMRDELAVEPDQPAAVVKLGKFEPVLQCKVGHRC